MPLGNWCSWEIRIDEFVDLHLHLSWDHMVINHVPVEVLIIQYFFNEYGPKTRMEIRGIETTLPI
jgi:hypothetical protein